MALKIKAAVVSELNLWKKVISLIMGLSLPALLFFVFEITRKFLLRGYILAGEQGKVLYKIGRIR